MNRRKPLFLLILDGYGLREEQEDNAVLAARTPVLSRCFSSYPFTSIWTSSQAVGLPEGFIGSSEVGHMNMGAGRIVLQGLERINTDIKKGLFYTNRALTEAMSKAKKTRLHVMGLLSDGGVHSHYEHLFCTLELAKKEGVKDVFVHVFLDGRDVMPSSAAHYLEVLEKKCSELDIGVVGSVHGRYYAMDRDHRWERVKKSYECLMLGKGLRASCAQEALKQAYERGETDEFVLPTLIREEGVIREGDVVIHTNYREDRARQLTAALASKEFSGFERAHEHTSIHYVCMVEYDSHYNLPVAYPWEVPSTTLGEYYSSLGGTQLRIAETEKYAHVTYFFNGGREEPFPGEDRVLIASDRSVATYDLQPGMKTMEIALTAVEYVRKHRPDLVVCNIAAPDMVGHTGNFSATVEALEVTDKAVGVIADCSRSEDYVLVITADHGNCEEMSGMRKTSHTLNPVPFCVVEHDSQGGVIWHRLVKKEKGVLGDISPTILKMIDVPIPPQMTRPGLIL